MPNSCFHNYCHKDVRSHLQTVVSAPNDYNHNVLFHMLYPVPFIPDLWWSFIHLVYHNIKKLVGCSNSISEWV